jgi:BirA family biotin operon repressor/biotin-[acetyl-CoA-carboxylase] ligase
MSAAGVERVIDDSPILLPTKSCGVFVLVVDPSRQRLDPGEQGREQARFCVVGVGINIAPPVADGLSTAPLGLQDLQSDITAPEALMKVAEPLLATLLAFERTGFAPLQNAFNARDALHYLNVTLSDGRHGVARGVDATGAMLVDTEQGQEAVSSSEVSVRPI